MRWFKLPTDDYASNHIDEIISTFGLEGLARWYLLCQLHYSNLDKNGDESEISEPVLRRVLRFQTTAKLHSYLTQVGLKSLLSVTQVPLKSDLSGTQVGLKFRLKILKYFKSNKTCPESIEVRDKSLEVRDKSKEKTPKSPKGTVEFFKKNSESQTEFLEPHIEFDEDPPVPEDFCQYELIENPKPRVKLRSVPHPDEPSKDFELFHQMYPSKRRCSRKEAWKAFKKIDLTKIPLSKLLADVAERKNTYLWKKDGEQYAPKETTYLNQHRWEEPIGPIEAPFDRPKDQYAELKTEMGF